MAILPDDLEKNYEVYLLSMQNASLYNAYYQGCLDPFAHQQRESAHAKRIETLERELAEACQQISILTKLLFEADTRWLRAQHADHVTLDESLLKELIVLAHPDRWDGHPLAHEITVRLNKLRDTKHKGV